MLIKNTRFNIVYSKTNSIRRKAFEIEDDLTDFFHPVTLIPVPDDAPEEIPRISTTSRNGHSQLNISLSNTQFVTNYDNNFEGDWKKCLGYLEERVNTIYSVLDKHINEKYLFSGLTTEIIFENFMGQDPIELIKNKFLNLEANHVPHELEQKLTFIVKDVYYVNITFKNLRVYDIPNMLTSGLLKNEKAHYLVCILDINDRYGFNHLEDYESDISKAKEIINITHSILEGKITKMITEGVFEI